MTTETRRVVCNFCHARCRVVVHSANGHLVDIEEDRSDPRVDAIFPPTRACIRLRGAREWMYHPDRVNFPLRRVGEKGEGKWERISWVQALDEIAVKLTKIKEKYGAEAIAATTGTGRTHAEYLGRFCNLLGTPNITGASTICFSPANLVSAIMFGWNIRSRVGLILDSVGGEPLTKTILLIGINPAQAFPRLWHSMRQGKSLGVKIIVIDPRRTQSADMADMWLQLRPGTDTALLMSMINVIIDERIYDKEFVNDWCYGFDKVVERAKDYTPEKVAKITWIPAEKIREAARMYALNRPAVAVHAMGIEHLQDNFQAIQARYILTAITGDVDAPGGEYLPGPSILMPTYEIECEHMLSAEQKQKQLGADRFRALAWPGRDLMQPHVKKAWGVGWGAARLDAMGHAPIMYRAILTGRPYPVKAVITTYSNPMLTQPNVKLVYEALKALEFYVVADYWLTPSAQFADYVLPVASWLERPYMTDFSGHESSIYGGESGLPSAIAGEYEHKTDFEIFRGLGVRMGQQEYWPYETLEEAYDAALKPAGLTFKDFMAKDGFHFPPPKFRKYLSTGFGTPTGKVELYSTIFEKLGYDPLPYYEEPFESPVSTPELMKDYPLMLTTGGRFHPMFHSEHRNIESSRKRHPQPRVQINPETARRLNIENGDWVWIETLQGKVRMKCLYFDGINPRVVHAEHGWWFPELPGEEPWLGGVWESNINVLTADDPDVCNKIGGGWPLKTRLCRVYKAKVY